MMTNYRTTPKNQIYHRIEIGGIASKAELLDSSGLTSSTLSRLLDEMLEQRLLTVSGRGQSSGGRKPILYSLNASYGYMFGLEISRFYSALGLFDMQMNPMSFTRWRMDEAMTPPVFAAHVAATIRTLLKDHQLEASQVLGIGIGAVGPLDREAGRILKPLHYPAPGWHDLPICTLIGEHCGLPAYLDNGANTALLGERWAMRRAQPQHMLYVHAGVGLRSAMMSHGQLVHGSIDREGAIGQMIIQLGGPRLQESGNYGALEAFASIQALEKQARLQARMGRSHLTSAYLVGPDEITFDLLMRALAQEDAAVRELFLQAAACFGIGLANLINIFHPEQVILGGTLVNAWEPFYTSSIETAIHNTYHYPDYRPSFSKGELREDAVATGAALMVRELALH
ncbi:ROK family protein [Paenibacillus sp. IB182496]|uniref:ROK family protein n=2 Tax=Paenibacillus sabuli TaxID=2772509 RepID=A0A927GRT6_9BACL|nr:ROK family protein [Paenibacillus sabuli]